MLNDTQIYQIQDFFSKQPVLKVYLFGSFVRDENQDHSDIDLLVDLDYTKPVGLKFLQMQIDLSQILSRKVDMVSSRGLSKEIAPIINKEKKLIYARPLG